MNFVVDSDDPLDLLLYENLEMKSFWHLGLPVVLVDSDVDVDSDVAVFVLISIPDVLMTQEHILQHFLRFR